MEILNKKEYFNKLITKGFVWSTVIGTIFLVALIVFVDTHFEETKKLLLIIKRSDPLWLTLAVLTQLMTYIFTGIVWHTIAKSVKYHLSLKSLAKLAIEKTSIDQLIPAGGIAGNVIIVKAMKRLGLPNALSVEVLCIDILAYHISFSFVIFLSLIILSLHHNITPIILSLVGVFFIVEILVTGIIWTVVNHKKLKLPEWIKNRKLVIRTLNAIEHVSHERVFSVKLLIYTSLLRLGIFLLSVGTLYTIMLAIGIESTLSTAFVAFVIASVARAITFLPGGLGGFEAGSITTLILLGVPLGEAIIATLLLRGLTLWIPLVPGLILAREDLGLAKK